MNKHEQAAFKQAINHTREQTVKRAQTKTHKLKLAHTSKHATYNQTYTQTYEQTNKQAHT